MRFFGGVTPPTCTYRFNSCVRNGHRGYFRFSVFVVCRFANFPSRFVIAIAVMSITIIASNTHVPSEEFRSKCSECLDMLMKGAGQYYSWMEKYDLKIRPAARSGANFADAAIDIASSTFNASKTWLASVFIHETVHFWQYRAGHYKAGTVAEKEANIYQLAVLRLLKAPQSEITHMLSQTGGHADINGDGVYDWKDYEKRNY